MSGAGDLSSGRLPEVAALLSAAGGQDYALALLAGILSTLPVAVGIYEATGDDYRVLYLNPATESFAGPVSEPYQGHTIGEAYPESLQNHVAELFDEVVHTGERQSRHQFTSHAGRVFNVDAYPVRGPEQKTYILQVAQEITELHRGQLRLQLGVELAVDLAARVEPNEILSRLLKRAVKSIEADRGTVSRIDGDEVVIEGSYDPRGNPVPAGSRWLIRSQPMLEEAILTQKVVRAGNVSTEGMPEPVARVMREIKHVLTVPMIVAGTVVGTLALSRTRDRPFSDDDMTTVSQIATVAAYSLRNARLYQQAQDANRAKAKFMNMAAHELRTPLSVISGYLSLLQDGSLGQPPDSWSEPMSVIAGKVSELAYLVDDVLTAARLDSGAIPPGAQVVEVATLVRDALDRVAPRVALLGATVETEIPSATAEVRVNPQHIGRIIDNLVNNALTYSRAPLLLQVSLTTSSTTARLSVRDNGKGIPDEARTRIFDQFVRIEDPSFGYPPGTGLGLYISRKLAETYGGTLELAWSEVGVGSEFALTLPLVHEAGVHAPVEPGGAAQEPTS
ncbi:MAG: ATP-binding protein [Candidatus Dormibacteria bacterium]